MKRLFFRLLVATVTISGLVFYWPTIQNFSSSITPNQEVTLLFVGDIMLSRHIGELIKAHEPEFPFALIKSTTKEADISFANLENPVSARGQDVGSIYSFRATPESLKGLKQAGFDIVSLANNHIWDYGEEAFLDTLKLLAEAEINFVGVGEDYSHAHAPVIIIKHGVRVAYLAYTDLTLPFLIRANSAPAVAFPELAKIKQSIQKITAENQADIVVVSFHWGNEYESEPTANQKRLARAVIDAGADIVIGHHPHTIQPVERYGEGVIAYSLGNFIFDQNFSDATATGLIFKAVVNRDGIVSVTESLVEFNQQFQPFLSVCASC